MRSPDDIAVRECVVSAEEAGLRLDVYLASQVEDASRSFLKQVIKDERVHVNERMVTRPSRTMAEGDLVKVLLPPREPSELQPEDIPLEVEYEDEDLLIVNKASGLVVHPGPGHATGTLVNAVIHRCREFERSSDRDEPEAAAIRPGIVHRLDRFTSGLMVVAKSQMAFDCLSKQAREHAFERRYVALVQGEFKEDSGVIRASIGRSLSDRKRMSVTSVNAREAVTRFEVRRRFGVASCVALRLETGRTHQIRLHLRFAGHAVLGDTMYGVSDYSQWPVSAGVREALEGLCGQALHAELLGLRHPRTGERMRFTSSPPADFQLALKLLESLETQ